MRLLITNDDGIYSLGLRALALGLMARHAVTLVAPQTQQSGAGHSFTLSSPLRMNAVRLDGLESIDAYAVNGTPVDCVKLALGNLKLRPDVVLSGVNMGENLGTDVLYSGTVSAAMESALHGIPSMAISILGHEPRHLDTPAAVASRLIPVLLKSGCGVLNVNVPDVPLKALKGIRFTHLSAQVYETEYVERLDTHNTKYYWIPSGKLTKVEPGEDTDERWTREEYASVTPLLSDITDERALTRLKSRYEERNDWERGPDDGAQ